MGENEVKKCPKCGGEMDQGVFDWSFRLPKKGDFLGDQIIPFYCKKCGYIELYKTPPARSKSFLKKCVGCGKEIPIASEECPHCGIRQPAHT